MDKKVPKYPVYVPSKGRSHNCLTAKFLIEDECPFFLVIEKQEFQQYAEKFGKENLLVLPFNGQGLTAARNWIKQHSIQGGHKRHWQLDDNIRCLKRRYKGKRFRCDSNLALSVTEEFVDRYENIAVAGLNYEMFLPNFAKVAPFFLNVHVYSCSLILNAIPFSWRLRYNDDTDLCLQALANNWCTVLFNAFLAYKVRTMVISGGNTDDLYQGDGRLVMAKALERMWPHVVETKRRFNRPQHVIRDEWKKFDTQLIRRKDIDWDKLAGTINEFGMKLVQKQEIKSERLREMVKDRLEEDSMKDEMIGKD